MTEEMERGTRVALAAIVTAIFALCLGVVCLQKEVE